MQVDDSEVPREEEHDPCGEREGERRCRGVPWGAGVSADAGLVSAGLVAVDGSVSWKASIPAARRVLGIVSEYREHASA
jgi:hypothetical protein